MNLYRILLYIFWYILCRFEFEDAIGWIVILFSSHRSHGMNIIPYIIVDAQYGSDGKMFKSSHNPVSHLANLRIMDSTIVFNEYYEIRVITKLPNSEQSWNESLNSVAHQFHQYQQQEQSPLILANLTDHKKYYNILYFLSIDYQWYSNEQYYHRTIYRLVNS